MNFGKKRRKPTKKWLVATVQDRECPDMEFAVHYDVADKVFWFYEGQSRFESIEIEGGTSSRTVGIEVLHEFDSQKEAESKAREILKAHRGLDWHVFISISHDKGHGSPGVRGAKIGVAFEVHAFAKSHGNTYVRCTVPDRFSPYDGGPEEFGQYISVDWSRAEAAFESGTTTNEDVPGEIYSGGRRWIPWTQESLDALMALEANIDAANKQLAAIFATPELGLALSDIGSGRPLLTGPVAEPTDH